jgi:hypothetical protein
MKITRGNFETTNKQVQAALTNEQITRQRVERVENLLQRPFWGRLKWLLFGR